MALFPPPVGGFHPDDFPDGVGVVQRPVDPPFGQRPVDPFGGPIFHGGYPGVPGGPVHLPIHFPPFRGGRPPVGPRMGIARATAHRAQQSAARAALIAARRAY